MSQSKSLALRWMVAVTAITAAVALALFATTASAHKRSFETNLQFKASAVTDTVIQFDGRVVSERAKCERNRTIHVDALGSRLAEATSLFNGDWLVQSTTRPPKGTTLIAFTPRKFLKRSKKHKHKCTSDFTERKAP